MSTNNFLGKVKNPILKPDRSEKTIYKKPVIIPAIYIDETDEYYILTMVATGFKKENFPIEIASNIITISAEKEFRPLTCTPECESDLEDCCQYDSTRWIRAFALPSDAVAVLAKGKYLYCELGELDELVIRIPKGWGDTSMKKSVSGYVY